MHVAHCYNYKLLIIVLFWSFSLLSGVDIYSRFTPGPVVLGACGTLLPARASEQGNVIGSVRIYIYIYICVCTKKNCN